ncbi:Voltage-gated Ion Channel (VIC) Superfamily, partial [Achlya hypogyna]
MVCRNGGKQFRGLSQNRQCHDRTGIHCRIAPSMKPAASAGPPHKTMKSTRKISPETQRNLVRDTSTQKFTTMATIRPPIFHKAATARTPIQRRGMALLEQKWYGALMSFVTIYCLFGDDFRAAFCRKSADNGFFVVAFICLLLFLFEFAVSCRCKPGYVFSFYFYLDIVATLSLIPDIGFIWSPLSNDDSVSSVSQAGSKAGRVVRVVRIIRLVRIVKLIKWNHSNDEQKTVIVESKTGGRMAEMTIRRVVMIVLFLCFVLPAFDGGYNESFNGFESRGFDTIHQMTTTSTDVTQSPIFLNVFGSWFYYTTDDIVYLAMYNISNAKMHAMFDSFTFPREDIAMAQVAKILPTKSAVLELYRTNELRSITSTGCFNDWNGSDLVVNPTFVSTACQSIVWFDISDATKTTATFNIYKTLFILVTLISSSLSFVHVARVTVLDPIERMMGTVKELAENPLRKHEHVEHEDQRLAKEKGFETAVLEATLDKI